MTVETKALKCIKCGKGCKLTVTLEDGKVTEVTGNKCSRGPKYAREKFNVSTEKDPSKKETAKKEKKDKKKKKVKKKIKALIKKIKKYLS